jgi:hypothetical protein
MARHPTMMAMYVEARGAHWLSGSSSLLTRCMFSNRTAERPSDAPEKAKTIIRKIKGINGFFSINLCSSISKVTVLVQNERLEKDDESLSIKIDDARLDADKKTAHSSKYVDAGVRTKQKQNDRSMPLLWIEHSTSRMHRMRDLK